MNTDIFTVERRKYDLVNYMGLALLIAAFGFAMYLGQSRQCADTTAPLKAKPPITRTIAPTVLV